MELIDRTGEINYNMFGSKMIISEYKNARNVIVEFENGYKTQSNYGLFKKGKIKSLYNKSVEGVGYLGEGKYEDKINGIATIEYVTWKNLLKRCYNKECQEKRPTYKGCTICDEWLNFQTFSQWYNDNWYEIDYGKMCLDKDILLKGNKIYSPKTCIFVPQKINNLFTKSDAKRGDYPIGVSWHKGVQLFTSTCNDVDKKRVHIGYHKTPEEAFYKGYKPFKEKVIKRVAEIYKDKIPQKLYDALYRYVVEITD